MEALGKSKVVKAVEKHGKLLSIRGQYDQPDKVMKFTYAAVKESIGPGQFGKVDINKYDLVIIGCPGNEIPSKYHIRFRDYVEQGGWLLSTDWVLKTIVEPIFPGYIRWNGEKTTDAVVACQIDQPSHPFMDGVLDSLKQYEKGSKSAKAVKAQMTPGMQPTFRWWLEAKSFPIDILRKDVVKTLISSYEIKKKWGAGPVFVYFPFGNGMIFHIISHTHLQKGASKGKYASAIILTNILDECIKWKYGVDSGRPRDGYQDPNAPVAAKKSLGSWEDQFQQGNVFGGSTPGMQDPYTTPVQTYQPTQTLPTYTPSTTPDPAQGVVPDFGGVAQAIENQLLQDRSIPCVVCAQDFTTYSGSVMECNECHAVYHVECLQQHVDMEGTCKSCKRVLLY
ncbi:MAG: hypothetical protein ACFFCS_07805 [Candidatus Hodarchaeota archaeon]